MSSVKPGIRKTANMPCPHCGKRLETEAMNLSDFELVIKLWKSHPASECGRPKQYRATLGD